MRLIRKDKGMNQIAFTVKAQKCDVSNEHDQEAVEKFKRSLEYVLKEDLDLDYVKVTSLQQFVGAEHEDNN